MDKIAFLFSTFLLILTAVSVDARAGATDSSIESKRPRGWGVVNEDIRDYDYYLDKTVQHQGRSSATIQGHGSPSDFGAFIQSINTKKYAGKRIRFSGYLQGKDITGWTALWLRVKDQCDQVIAFDNMKKRSLKGTKPWQEFSAVVDVPENSKEIAYGFLLQGPGQVWADDFTLETVDQSINVTDSIIEKPPTCHTQSISSSKMDDIKNSGFEE